MKRSWRKARMREHDSTKLPCKTRQGCRARLDKAAVHEEGLFEKILAEGQDLSQRSDRTAVHDSTRLPCMTRQGCRA